MASRRLEDLLPDVAALAAEHRSRCLEKRIDLLIYCTLRDAEEQGRLYCQDRTAEQITVKRDALRGRGFARLAAMLGSPQPGKRITNTGPGESYHQYGLAYDCVPTLGGKPVWSTSGESAALWENVGRIGEKAGLEWAGRWTTFRELPHFQLKGDQSLDQLMTARYGADATTGHVAPALLANTANGDEVDGFRQLLQDPIHRIFVVLSGGSASEAALRKKHEMASIVAQWNPVSWCTFWIKQPTNLPPNLKRFLGVTAAASPIVMLGEGEETSRRATLYTLEATDEPHEIWTAFTEA